MSRQHVEVRDVRSLGQRELIDAKAIRIWEVVTQLAVKLIDIGVLRVSYNRNLGLQRSIWNIAL